MQYAGSLTFLVHLNQSARTPVWASRHNVLAAESVEAALAEDSDPGSDRLESDGAAFACTC